jgi:hypothetical protein
MNNKYNNKLYAIKNIQIITQLLNHQKDKKTTKKYQIQEQMKVQ